MHGKRCRICELDLPLSAFGKHARHKDGLQNYCRLCRNALNRDLLTDEQRARKAANAKRYVFRRMVNRRGMRYGVTPEEFEAMKAEQDGKCAICLGSETYEHKELCVDHDHTTGQVRGLLCSRCNKALGGFKDSSELLASAIAYLQSEVVWHGQRGQQGQGQGQGQG